jgi:hypothetical protein
MSQIRSNYAKCLVTMVSNVLTLIPLNDVGNDVLAAFFTAEGDSDTVAITQADSGRGGYGVTSGPYNNLIFTCTTA